ncbi:MAG: aspartyl protease family protein [Candidatus Kapaibacterium sp.]
MKCLLISTLLVLVSCAGYQNEFTISPGGDKIEKDTLTITNYEGAIALFMPYNYEQSDALAGPELALARGVELIRRGMLAEAEELIEREVAEGDTIRPLAELFLNIIHDKYPDYGFSRPAVEFDEGKVNASFPDGRAYAEVGIAGKKYIFLIDNGYSKSSINQSIIRELGLDAAVGTLASRDLGGEESTDSLYILPEIEIGNIIVRELLITSDRSGHQGIIGWDILSQIDLRIDFAHKSIEFRRPGNSQSEKCDYFWVQTPVLYAHDCNGIPVKFIFDLGANMTFLSDRYFDITPNEFHKVGSKTGSMKVASGKEHEFEIDIAGGVCLVLDDYIFNFSKIILSPEDFRTFTFISGGILGCDLWQSGAIRLDYRNNIFEYTHYGNE